jgi:polar amino acid transport system substrate-binding protein
MQIERSNIAGELAPGGTLRAAINLGNSVLAQRSESGELGGVSVALARKLAEWLELPVELVPFQAAGKVFEALPQDVWDLAFLAIEPVRADAIDFTPPYVVIEGAYMVRDASPLRELGDVDRPGVRIAVGRGSAYHLFLTRTLKHAEVVPAHTGGSKAMIDLFLDENLEVVAGVRGWLEDHAAAHPGFRVMEGRFQEIRQAMGVPKGRSPSALAFLRDFIEEMKSSGFVEEGLRSSGQLDARVAPPGG